MYMVGNFHAVLIFVVDLAVMKKFVYEKEYHCMEASRLGVWPKTFKPAILK